MEKRRRQPPGARRSRSSRPGGPARRRTARRDLATRQQQLVDSAAVALRAYLEFLFSDSNLDKDAHLLTLMSADGDGFVPLSEIACFRRVLTLLRPLSKAEVPLDKRVSLLRRAVVASPFLRSRSNGSTNGSSDAITHVASARPRTSHPRSYYEERTLYVEGLTPASSVQSLGAYFAQFGAVAYVALPRTKGGSRRCA